MFVGKVLPLRSLMHECSSNPNEIAQFLGLRYPIESAGSHTHRESYGGLFEVFILHLFVQSRSVAQVSPVTASGETLL